MNEDEIMTMKKNLFVTALAASLITVNTAGMSVMAETVTEAEEAYTENVYVLPADPGALLVQNAAEYIDLTDLTALELTSYYSTVTDEEIDMQLQNLQYEYISYESVSGGAEEGDYLTMNMTYTVDGETETEPDLVYEVGYAEYGEAFDEAMYGAKVGETIEVETSFSEDDFVYEDWLGKTVSFSLEITEAARAEIPELTEEFVQETLGYESMEECREALREELQYSTDLQNEQTSISMAVETAVDESVFYSYPEELVDEALENIHAQYASLAEMFGMEVDELYEAYGIDQDALQEQAENTVSYQILVSAVIQQEELSFTAEDVYAAAEELAPYYEYDSAESLLTDAGDDFIYAAAEQIVGTYLLQVGQVTEEEEVSYTDDLGYMEDDDSYYIDGDADAWFEDETDDGEEYWDDDIYFAEEDDAYWEEDTE